MEFNHLIYLESLLKVCGFVKPLTQITNERELTGTERNKKSEESHSEVKLGIKLRHFAAVVTSLLTEKLRCC